MSTIQLNMPQPERKRPRPQLAPILTHMQLSLAPLVPYPQGPPHPAFPKAIINFHLLTEAEMDSIARYYHQDPISPSIWMNLYPACMNWNREFLNYLDDRFGHKMVVDSKRRMIGKFIGLRGCETPVQEAYERELWTQKKRDAARKAAFLGL